MNLGKGRAEAISDADVSNLANELGVHPADLEAISNIESSGFGWFKDGRIKILFEKHWMYKQTSGSERNRAVRAGVARKHWVSPKRGGYKDQSNAASRYRLLAKAIAVNEEMALRSISMGKYQIMGFNYAICGFVSAKHMWTRFLDSEANQLQAFAKFLKNKNLVTAVRTRNFRRVEDIYNGGGLNGCYAKRMKQESGKLRRGKWKNWKPGEIPPQRAVQPRQSNTAARHQKPVAVNQNGGWKAAIKAFFSLFKRRG